MTNRFRVLLLGATALLALVGCPGNKPQAPATTPAAPLVPKATVVKGGTIRLPLPIAIDDPVLQELDFSDHRLFALARCLEMPLVRCDSAGNLSPGLAQSWETPDNGLTWIFNLQEYNIVTDGLDDPEYPARQFETRVRRILRGTDGPLKSQLSDLLAGAADYQQGTSDEISGISIENRLLTLKLTRPYLQFPLWLSQPGLGAMYTYNPVSAEQSGNLEEYFGGFGSFLLTGIDGNELDLGSLPQSGLFDYPLVDKIRFVCVPDWGDQLELFKKGELHAAIVPQGEYSAVKDDDVLNDLSVRVRTAVPVTGVFDLHDSPWGDQTFHSKVPLRQALNWAVDRDYLVEAMNGEFVAWPHFLPEEFKDAIPGDYIHQPPNPLVPQIEDAQAALRRADHWDGIHLPRGMDLAWQADEPLRPLAVEILEDWNFISIKLRPLPDEKEILLGRIDIGTHEIILRKSYPAYPDPEALLYAQLHSSLGGRGGNWSMLDDPWFDEKLAAIQATDDALLRQKLMQSVSRKLEDDALFAFLGYLAPMLVISDELAGYELTAFDFDASLPGQNFAKLWLQADDGG